MLKKVAEKREVLDYAAIGARIKYLRMQKNQTQSEFSELFGKGRALVSRIETGHVKPSNTLLDIIICDWNVNPKWLYRGEGEIFLRDTNPDLENLK
jgi:transcriptional regulator with XRE-family HTH domain